MTSLDLDDLAVNYQPRLGFAGRAEEHPEKYEIRVADKTFPMSRWREAILYFLFGIWSGDKKFWHEPSICFGELKLVLKNRDSRTPEKSDIFVIEGDAPDKPNNSSYGNYPLKVGNGRGEVMEGLVRFAKDPTHGRVTISIDERTDLVFNNKERPSEYSCFVYRYKN